MKPPVCRSSSVFPQPIHQRTTVPPRSFFYQFPLSSFVRFVGSRFFVCCLVVLSAAACRVRSAFPRLSVRPEKKGKKGHTEKLPAETSRGTAQATLSILGSLRIRRSVIHFPSITMPVMFPSRRAVRDLDSKSLDPLQWQKATTNLVSCALSGPPPPTPLAAQPSRSRFQFPMLTLRNRLARPLQFPPQSAKAMSRRYCLASS